MCNKARKYLTFLLVASMAAGLFAAAPVTAATVDTAATAVTVDTVATAVTADTLATADTAVMADTPVTADTAATAAAPVTAATVDTAATAATDVFTKESAVIDIGSFSYDEQSKPGQAAWEYTLSGHRLTLKGAGCLYTLYGTSADLSIAVASSAIDSCVTLSNIDSSNSRDGLAIFADCEVRLDGANKLTGGGRGLYIYGATANITQGGSLDIYPDVDGMWIYENSKLIISGGASVSITSNSYCDGVIIESSFDCLEVARGSTLNVNGGKNGLICFDDCKLTVDGAANFSSSTDDGIGISIPMNSYRRGNLDICGNGTINVAGAEGIRCLSLTIDAAEVTVLGQKKSALTVYAELAIPTNMGDAAILKITRSDNNEETHRFINTGESNMYKWKLVNATTPDALTDDKIDVTVLASSTGIIMRELATTQPALIAAAAVTGVTSPVRGAAPSAAINNGAGFAASLAWDGAPAAFAPGSVYTATITLTAASGYTFSGGYGKTAEIAGFTVNGAAPVWVSNNGAVLVFKVTFPATAPAESGNGGYKPSGGSGSGRSNTSGGGAVDLSNPSLPLGPATPTPTPAPSASPTPSKKSSGSLDTAPDNTLTIPHIAPRPRKFIDVPDGHWALGYIEELAKNRIIDGYPEDGDTFSYRPDNNITRAEVIKLLAASLQLELENNFDGSRFADWGEVEDWAKPYVGAAVNAGFVYGSLEGGLLYVNANSNITRQETVAMAMRVLDIDVEGWEPPAATPDFAEAEDWAQPTLAFAVNNEMINIDNGQIRPLADATRAETAMVLFKMLKYIYG